MPEIWLSYGSVEANVDIRAENLGRTVDVRPTTMDSAALDAELAQIGIDDDTLLLLPEPDPSNLKVLAAVIQRLEPEKTPKIAVATLTRHQSTLKRGFEGMRLKISPLESGDEPNRGEGKPHPVPAILDEYRNKVLISTVRFDPLFGFRGGPVTLLRAIQPQLMGEALRRDTSREPTPGRVAKASEVALELAETLPDLRSIELAPTGGDVSAIYSGSLRTAHIEASNYLLRTSHEILDEGVRSMVVSPGSEQAGSTLRQGLGALWNCLGGMRQSGTIVLLAECSSGLGDEALSRFVAGRLAVEDLVKKGIYVEGIEDIRFLQYATSRFNVVLVSTLPKYYVESKLGLRSASKVSEAMSHLYSTQGARTKVCLVPFAADTLISTERQTRTAELNP